MSYVCGVCQGVTGHGVKRQVHVEYRTVMSQAHKPRKEVAREIPVCLSCHALLAPEESGGRALPLAIVLKSRGGYKRPVAAVPPPLVPRKPLADPFFKVAPLRQAASGVRLATGQSVHIPGRGPSHSSEEQKQDESWHCDLCNTRIGPSNAGQSTEDGLLCSDCLRRVAG
jgi:hypothetical protein